MSSFHVLRSWKASRERRAILVDAVQLRKPRYAKSHPMLESRCGHVLRLWLTVQSTSAVMSDPRLPSPSEASSNGLPCSARSPRRTPYA